MARRKLTCRKIDVADLSARSLRQAATLHPDYNWQAARVWISADGAAEASPPAQVLYRPETGRAGVAWEGEARWANCDSIEDAVRWYLAVRDAPAGEAEA